MAKGDHRHRAYLFLAAILLPSAVLVGTTLQVIRQERELAERRWREDRSNLALDLGQELLTDLRELDERLSGISASPSELYQVQAGHPALVTVARWHGEALVFPWEGRSDSVAARLATVQDLEALREEVPALSAAARTRSDGRGGGTGPVWVSYGDEPWLLGLPREAGEEAGLLPVIRPSFLLNAAEGYEPGLAEAARAARIVHDGEEEGEPLGSALNGLGVSFPADFPPPPGEGTIEGWFYRLLLPLILLLTGITAYLAWRDVRRESDAVRLRSQFVSSVTHELKTPLTSIRMFAETLRLGRQSSPEAREEYLDTVIHETQRLGQLINNVLDFARIDRGEMAYHLAPTDLEAVVREAAQAVA
jgi:hypothetical protein